MKINQHIDHTALKSTTTVSDIEQLCAEAKQYQFASVCINPCFVELAERLLINSGVKICTVVGFPLGNTSTIAKVQETIQAKKDGAKEFDMVINQSFLKSRKLDLVKKDIEAVKEVLSSSTLKVILEICNLTDEEIEIASKISEEAGADYIKTSTGFGSGGATIKAVKLMSSCVSENMKIKASGGIRTYKKAKSYLRLGVDRIGTSSGVQIIEDAILVKSY